MINESELLFVVITRADFVIVFELSYVIKKL